MNGTLSDYPRLEQTPDGRSTQRSSEADITPATLTYDTVEHVGPSMTVARDGSPPMPLLGRTSLGEGPTNSSVVEQTKRRLDNDLALRAAIEADGQSVESFDISRGTSSRMGDRDIRSVSELKDSLAEMTGPEAVERRRFDKAIGRG